MQGHLESVLSPDGLAVLAGLLDGLLVPESLRLDAANAEPASEAAPVIARGAA
jgi:hypothetical protein